MQGKAMPEQPNVDRVGVLGKGYAGLYLSAEEAAQACYVACAAGEVIDGPAGRLRAFVRALAAGWQPGAGDVAVWRVSADGPPRLVALVRAGRERAVVAWVC
jgi:hypothetical protein